MGGGEEWRIGVYTRKEELEERKEEVLTMVGRDFKNRDREWWGREGA